MSLLLILLAMISIQFGASMAKGLFPLFGPYGATTLRLGFASLLMLMVWRPWRTHIDRKKIIFIALYGCSLGGMNLCFFISLEKIPLGVAVALEFVGPFTVAMLSSRKLLDMIWAILAAIGIVLFLPLSGFSEKIDLLGIGFALASGFFWGLYMIFGKKASSHIPSGVASAWGMCFAVLTTLPFGIFHAGEKIFEISLWPLGLMVAFFSSALPYSLEMFSLKRLSTKTFGILMSLEPAVAAIMGLCYLKEALSPLQWLAMALVMASSLGVCLTTENKLASSELPP